MSETTARIIACSIILIMAILVIIQKVWEYRNFLKAIKLIEDNTKKRMEEQVKRGFLINNISKVISHREEKESK
jgi:hypothetical protein